MFREWTTQQEIKEHLDKVIENGLDPFLSWLEIQGTRMFEAGNCNGCPLKYWLREVHHIPVDAVFTDGLLLDTGEHLDLPADTFWRGRELYVPEVLGDIISEEEHLSALVIKERINDWLADQ